jgi:hypothetical protein
MIKYDKFEIRKSTSLYEYTRVEYDEIVMIYYSNRSVFIGSKLTRTLIDKLINL